MKTTIQVNKSTIPKLLDYKVSNSLKSMDSALNKLLDAEDEHSTLMNHLFILPDLNEEALLSLRSKTLDNEHYIEMDTLWTAIQTELDNLKIAKETVENM